MKYIKTQLNLTTELDLTNYLLGNDVAINHDAVEDVERARLTASRNSSTFSSSPAYEALQQLALKQKTDRENLAQLFSMEQVYSLT